MRNEYGILRRKRLGQQILGRKIILKRMKEKKNMIMWIGHCYEHCYEHSGFIIFGELLEDELHSASQEEFHTTELVIVSPIIRVILSYILFHLKNLAN
jgi:hypothetical protein